jgi:small multidrug resistance pump
MYWVFLVGAMIAAVFGQALLKAGSGAGSFFQQLLDLRTILGLGCYGGSALLYMVALRGIPLSIALPATALSYIAVAMIGHFIFHEPIGMQRMAGLGMILVGVLVLGTS